MRIDPAGFKAGRNAKKPLARWSVALLVASGMATPVAHAATAFQESGGQVVIETEHPFQNWPRNSKTWTLETLTSGFSGTGYFIALPNSGTKNSTDYALKSPELQYLVTCTTTGTYYIWVRGYAATTNDDAIHAGLNGTTPSTADKITSAVFLGKFDWTRDTADGVPAKITIAAPGVHVVQFWMYEDGLQFDKVLLTTNPSSTPPSGFGPSESQQVTISDATAPTAPGRPTEGGTQDKDYDSDGAYTIYWSLASDFQSAVVAYELQEKLGPTGTWTPLTPTPTTDRFAVTGRQHNKKYFYHVRAQNGVGLWSGWSPDSDGILVDTSKPTTPVVTDDGATTSSTTQLHDRWTASSDPESGIAAYEYQIRQDSITGPLIRNWTSVGLVLEYTATGLTLTNGKTYFFGVRAKNGAGTYSNTGWSDGILVVSDAPPTGTVLINAGAESTNAPTVTLTLDARDDSGPVALMKFSNDDRTYADPIPYATTVRWDLSPGDGVKTVYAKFADAAGNWSEPATDTITLDTRPPEEQITQPADGQVFGAE